MVEEDPTTLKARRALLTRRGWDVACASSIAEALRLLDLAPPCMKLDLMLPVGEGTTVLQAVRDSNRGTRVVVATGTLDAARMEAMARLRPHAVLFKPIDLRVLHRCLGPVP